MQLETKSKTLTETLPLSGIIRFSTSVGVAVFFVKSQASLTESEKIYSALNIENGNQMNGGELDEVKSGPYRVMKDISNTMY